ESVLPRTPQYKSKRSVGICRLGAKSDPPETGYGGSGRVGSSAQPTSRKRSASGPQISPGKRGAREREFGGKEEPSPGNRDFLYRFCQQSHVEVMAAA